MLSKAPRTAALIAAAMIGLPAMLTAQTAAGQ